MDTANDPSYTPTPTKKSRVVVDTEPRPVEMPTSAEAPPLFMECEDEPLSAAQKTHRQEHAKTLKEAMDKLEVLAAKNPTIQVWSLTQFYSVDFKIKDQSKKVRFHQTHNQGLRQLLLTVSWDLCA